MNEIYDYVLSWTRWGSLKPGSDLIHDFESLSHQDLSVVILSFGIRGVQALLEKWHVLPNQFTHYGRVIS